MDESKKITGLATKLSSCNAVFRHFDLADSAEGEEQLDEKFGWILGRLTDDVSHSSRNRGMEQDAFCLKSCKVDAHSLSRLKGSHHAPHTAFRWAPRFARNAQRKSRARTRLWLHPLPIANR